MKLSIEKAVYGGLGLSRVDGKTFFVPLTLPGEEIEAHIVEEKRSFSTAALEQVLSPSPLRVEAPCPYFARCGGCHYQHSTYAGQLEIKKSVLEETFSRAGLKDLSSIEVLSAEPWTYRNRIRLLVTSGASPLAYRGWKSNEAVAIEGCPIAAPILDQSLRSLAAIASACRLQEWAKEVELFCNDGQTSVLLSVTARRRVEKSLVQQTLNLLQEQVPELRGVSVFSSGEGKDEDARGPLVAQAGEQFLDYRVSGRSYRVSAGSFFQVNRYLVDTLVDRVTKNRTGSYAWDLYAGVGLFGQALADSFSHVVAVEAAPSSGADLAHNLPGTHDRVRMGTLDFLRRNKRTVQKPELIVVDPPRAGLGKEVTGLLTEIACRQLVYVSCDPSTLARDLGSLLQSGYRLRKLSMVDLFPQTFHMESIAELERD